MTASGATTPRATTPLSGSDILANARALADSIRSEDLAAEYVENDGRRAVGEEVGSGDDIEANASGDDIEMFVRENVNCRKYVFNFVGLDRLEGRQSFTVRVPFSDDCDTFDVGQEQDFFAERID